MATGTFCGTGAWGNAPKPGDPDGYINLWATPAFGGIDVEWTYPGINPEAVAFVRLYRSTNLTDEFPALHKIVTGTFFYDKTASATPIEYAYWIELVSINGTVGDRVGPAVATARPTIAEIMEGLTAQIDAGMLAQSLKGEIEKIDLNWLENQQALIDQAAVDDSLAVAFTQLQAHSDDTRAILQEEKVARVEADNAFVNQLNTAQVQLGDDIASVQTNLTSEIDYINGDLSTIGAKFTVKTDVNGLIGGFGTYNDGNIVEAGFDVDRFWVGRTNDNKRKPFIIEDNEVFIDEAAINTLTFNKLRADNGSLIVENGMVKADYIRAKWANIEGVSIGTADIQDAAITTAKIGNAQITNAKIGDAQITNAKIGNAAVDTLSIAGNAVTVPASYNYDGSKSVGGDWAYAGEIKGYSSSGGKVHLTVGFSYSGNVSATEDSNNTGASASIRVDLRILYNGSILKYVSNLDYARDDSGDYSASASIKGYALVMADYASLNGDLRLEARIVAYKNGSVQLSGTYGDISMRSLLALGVRR